MVEVLLDFIARITCVFIDPKSLWYWAENRVKRFECPVFRWWDSSFAAVVSRRAILLLMEVGDGSQCLGEGCTCACTTSIALRYQ